MTQTNNHQATSETPNRPAVCFVCDYCGAPRTAKLLSATARLKCAGCGLTTNHSIAGIRDNTGTLTPREWHEDWREHLNTKAAQEYQQVARLEQFLRNNNIDVQRKPSRELDGRKAYGYLYSVNRDRRSGQDHFWVEVATEATTQGMVHALTEAIRRILTDPVWQSEGKPGTGYIGWNYSSRNDNHMNDRDDSERN